MATLYVPYLQAISGSTGAPLAGATLGFFLAGTTTPFTVFQDADENTPHENPVTADAGGLFPPIYVPAGQSFKTVLKRADGVSVQTVDDQAPRFSGEYDDLSGKPELGNSAGLNVGTSEGTVAAGGDERIVGAVQKAAEGQTLSGGAGVDPKDLETVTTGTTTINVAARPIQTMINGGASALDVGSAYGWCLLCITNNGSAGAISLTAFDVVEGDDLTTVEGGVFECDIRHTPAAKSIFIKAI